MEPRFAQKQKNKYVRNGFLEDLVIGNFCDSDDLSDVLDKIKKGECNVVRAGEEPIEYFLAFYNKSFYYVETAAEIFMPGCREVPVLKVERIDSGRDRLYMAMADSNHNSILVKELYRVVEEYWQECEMKLSE
jgi:hypothetical protein